MTVVYYACTQCRDIQETNEYVPGGYSRLEEGVFHEDCLVDYLARYADHLTPKVVDDLYDNLRRVEHAVIVCGVRK